MDASYKICLRCVMDTSDPQISFDHRGYCNHCVNVEENFLHKRWFPENDFIKINHALEEVRKNGQGKPYDCIIGLSGGTDSSYLAHLVVKEFGLRPLAVHVDAGWNSEAAVHNIENIVRKLNIDLYTEVIDWEEVQDLQRAYIRAGVANQDVPQDHVFFTVLYRVAKERNIKYFLSGRNFATESILPISWGYDAMDPINLKSIHKKFGERKLTKYPTTSFFKRYIYYRCFFKLKEISPLNYIEYNREKTISILMKELNWKNYGDKHHESRWTKWFQGYYLPKRFGYDKRKAHLSSMIMSNEITREEALARLIPQSYDENERRIDEEFIIKKLGMTRKEFDECFEQKLRHYSDFPNGDSIQKIKNIIKKLYRF